MAGVAHQLGVSRAWVYHAAKRGRIPSIRIGGEEGFWQASSRLPADFLRMLPPPQVEVAA